VDLSHLDYVDSAGLEVFISLHKRCVKEGGSLAVRGLSGPVKELFEITRLDKVFLWE
jgi:anti-sigma B factor antagonist